MVSVSKTWTYSILSGLLMALSWPTYGFPFLMFIAWVPLLLLEHEIRISDTIQRKTWKIFGFSYLTFLIFNVIAVHWLLLVSVNKFGAFVPTVFANTLLMSLFFMVYSSFKKTLGTKWGLACLPFIWILFEKMQLTWELNWPWLNLGNVFASWHQWIQWYSLTGTLGGTFWILVLNVWVFYFYKVYLVTRKRSYLKKIGWILGIGIGLPSLFSWYLYNSYEDEGEVVEVLLLQPEIDPYVEKYETSSWQLTQQLATMIGEATPNTQLIVGPETAIPGKGYIPYEQLDTNKLLSVIQNELKKTNAVFVTGADVVEIVNGEGKDVNYDSQSGTYYKRYNAAIQMSSNEKTKLYVKSKLVPMVEYFSYQNLLKPILGKTMLDFGGSTNTLARPLEPVVFSNDKNNILIAPTVCYESVFGAYTAQFVKQGANLISISTNDSWWSDSQGHKQLLAFSKLRAIENRRYIARSANSGISAVINGRGDVLSQLPYLYEGALPAQVKLHNKQTYYTQNGDYIANLAVFIISIALGFVIALRLGKRMKKYKS